MSEVKVNSIKGVGASVAAISINNTDGTCTANLTNRTNKNLIVNGAFLISQRGTSSTSSGLATVDRFGVSVSGTDESPTQSQADVASGTTPYALGFRKSYKITNGNQTSGAGTGDRIMVYQNMEAQNIAQSGWNYTSPSSFITLSFWAKSSVAQTFYVALTTQDGTSQRYGAAVTFASANTWTKFTYKIPGNSNLTFDNNVERGLQVFWTLFRGTDTTDNSFVLNQWAAYNSSIRYPDITSTWYTTNDATFELTGVQLEVSDHATSFEHRSYADEIIRCERYYRRDAANGVVYYRFAQGQCTSSTGTQYVVKWPTRMRAAPTYAVSGTITIYTVNSQNSSSSHSLLDQTTQGGILTCGAPSGLSSGNCADLIAGNDGNAYVEYMSEI